MRDEEFGEKICPICHKVFYPRCADWVYKAKGRNKSKRIFEGQLLCSYHCMRETEKYKGKRGRKPKAAIATLQEATA